MRAAPPHRFVPLAAARLGVPPLHRRRRGSATLCRSGPGRDGPGRPRQSRCRRAISSTRRLPAPARRRRPRREKRLHEAAATKVVATLGPASSDRAVISRLFEAGADVFRINMSHTSHDGMRELVITIRAIEADHNRPIGILVDLQGPNPRLGAFTDDAADLDKGQEFMFDTDPTPGDATRVHLPHPEIFAAIKPGDALLIDDGKLRLEATERHRNASRRVSKSAAKFRTAKASACPTPSCRSRRWRPRTSPISKQPSTPVSTGSRCRSSSVPKISRRRRRSRAAAPR